MLQAWKTFDQKITDAANEAKDNVKILYSLLTYCQPLYYSDPVSIKPEIKKMMEAILIIYTTSQHYNTTDCMTHLFVKVRVTFILCCLRLRFSCFFCVYHEHKYSKQPAVDVKSLS